MLNLVDAFFSPKYLKINTFMTIHDMRWKSSEFYGWGHPLRQKSINEAPFEALFCGRNAGVHAGLHGAWMRLQALKRTACGAATQRVTRAIDAPMPTRAVFVLPASRLTRRGVSKLAT